MLFAMAEHLELPRPRRLMLTAGWNLAESLGLPVAGYLVGAHLDGRNAGMLAATGVVWLTVVGRKVLTHSVPSLLTISALVLTLQTAVVIVTGSMLFFLLQFPLANLGLCVLFARTAPTRKPLVAQLAAEVVALRQPSAHHPGLHRFFQGATWLWAGIFFVTTVGLAVLMATETVRCSCCSPPPSPSAAWSPARFFPRSGSSGSCTASACASASPSPEGGQSCREGFEFGDAGQQAVDERGRGIGGQLAGEQHGLADRHAVRHVVGPEQLVDADPQHVPVHGGHPVQGPPLGVLREQLVDPGRMHGHAADQVRGVGGHRRTAHGDALGEQLKDWQAAQFGLEEDVQGPLARLATGGRH